MNRLVLRIASVATAALLFGGRAAAFGITAAHEELARVAVELASQSSSLDSYLRDDLGLNRGLGEPLAVQFGLDAQIDEDLITDASQSEAIETRLNRSLSALDSTANGPAFRPFAPFDVRVFFDNGCRTALDFDTCYAALERARVDRLIQIGTYAEDNPNPRSQHHFHDPERSHGASGHGLDNSSQLSDSLAGIYAVEGLTLLRGGSWWRALAAVLTFPVRPQAGGLGNFDLRGLSAIDRALNRPGLGEPASEEYPKNLFALPDAERYLYRALTSAAKDDRENYLALHFIALGHVLHLLQDQASSPHTRNDFIRDHVLGDLLPGDESLETSGDDPDTVRNVMDEIGLGDLLRSLPAAHLAALGLDTSFHLNSQEAVDANGIDVADFWDRGSLDDPEQNPSLAGLAERVHNNFFSEGSISNSIASNGYALPRVPSCSLGDSAGSGANEVRTVSLPGRSIENGATIGGARERFLSSPLVPHLARCRFHALRAAASTVPLPISPWATTVRDSSVQRDYLELLFPLAIEYGAKFLQHYLAARIEVVPTGDGKFKLRNLTALAFTSNSDAIEVAYTAEDANSPEGVRTRVELDCGPGELVLPPKPTNGDAPLGAFTCTLPAALPATPLDRQDFWVVARGRLGQRGEVATPEEFDSGSTPEGFVVAFDHVQPQLLIHGATEDSAYVEDDERYPIDLFLMPLDLGHPIEDGDVTPARINLTAALRANLGSEALDFVVPSGEPGGVRIALHSDRDAVEDLGTFPRVGAPLEAFLFNPTLDPSDPNALAVLPVSELKAPNGKTHLTTVWSNDRAGFFYFEDGSQPTETGRDNLHRYEMETSTRKQFTTRLAYTASQYPDTPAADLQIGDTRDVCSGLDDVSAHSLTVVAGTANCHREIVIQQNGQQVWSQTSSPSRPSPTPEIRIADVVASAEDPALLEGRYTKRIDVGAGADVGVVVECGNSSTCWQRGSEPDGENSAFEDSPVFSPDGQKLAFLRDPTGILDADTSQEIWIADLASGVVRKLMGAEHGDPGVVQWSPDGRWLVFGLSRGAAQTADPGGALDESEVDIDVFSLRADSIDPQTPEQLTSGLKPYTIGIYAPLVLPAAP